MYNDALADVEAALKIRKATMMDNDLVRIHNFLNPKHDKADLPFDYTEAARKLHLFCKARRVDETLATPERCLEECQSFFFENHPRSEYLDFWQHVNPRRYSLLRFFALEIVKVLQTEAAVERSFRIEADTWTPYRNKLHKLTVQRLVFIRMNHGVLTEPLAEKPKPKLDLSHAQWEAMIEEIINTGPRTTHRTKLKRDESLRALEFGRPLEVLFIIGGVEKWCRGVIVDVPASGVKIPFSRSATRVRRKTTSSSRLLVTVIGA
jgi:hypothetical protein